jgi:hypothetical protein
MTQMKPLSFTITLNEDQEDKIVSDSLTWSYKRNLLFKDEETKELTKALQVVYTYYTGKKLK